MMTCWRENPHERPTFRGLATFFRSRSFALGTLAQYELAAAHMSSRMASRVEENSARAASLIADAVKEGKQKKKHKRLQPGPLPRSASSSSMTNSLASTARDRNSLISETEFSVGRDYVDLMGKVQIERSRKLGEEGGGKVFLGFLSLFAQACVVVAGHVRFIRSNNSAWQSVCAQRRWRRRVAALLQLVRGAGERGGPHVLWATGELAIRQRCSGGQVCLGLFGRGGLQLRAVPHGQLLLPSRREVRVCLFACVCMYVCMWCVCVCVCVCVCCVLLCSRVGQGLCTVNKLPSLCFFCQCVKVKKDRACTPSPQALRRPVTH
jgi:hypothetical protein